jgi:hypothetical protein
MPPDWVHTMSIPRPNSIRFPVDPRDVAPDKAARRMGLTLGAFNLVKDQLYARGFPQPDPTTGNYDLRAIDVWMDQRSGIAPAAALTGEPAARNASDVFKDRMARFSDGQR